MSRKRNYTRSYQFAAHRADLLGSMTEEAQLAGRLEGSLPAEQWREIQQIVEALPSTWERRNYLLSKSAEVGL